jgi:hypothetical protein
MCEKEGKKERKMELIPADKIINVKLMTEYLNV